MTEQNGPKISAIVSIGKNLVIGRSDKLMWPIPEDLKRFRELTRNHPVIMGRKTFESILSYRGKPLPDRTNIIVTHDADWKYEGVIVTHSIEEAIKKAREFDQKEIFIIGGAQIYKQSLPYVDKLYLTLIDDEKPGDAYFPPYEHLFTKVLFDEAHELDGLKYRWVDVEK